MAMMENLKVMSDSYQAEREREREKCPCA